MRERCSAIPALRLRRYRAGVEGSWCPHDLAGADCYCSEWCAHRPKQMIPTRGEHGWNLARVGGLISSSQVAMFWLEKWATPALIAGVFFCPAGVARQGPREEQEWVRVV